MSMSSELEKQVSRPETGKIFRLNLKKQQRKAEEKLLEEEKKKEKRESTSQPILNSRLRGKKKAYKRLSKGNKGEIYHSNIMNFYNNAFRGYNNYSVWNMYDNNDYDDDFLDNFI